MKGKGILVAGILISMVTSCTKKIIPDKPFLTKADFRLDTLPESEINIPVQINLKPLYALAENSIDTIFTSPGWPDAWVTADCATRYKYNFRRGPLQTGFSGQTLNLGFTGYYKIIGSTRICAGSAVLSPWTPPCRCGFEEGERRVKVNFQNSVTIQPDYKIRLNILRQEPEPLDQCQVCFFGADITRQVMNGLKEELDLAKKNIENSFGVVDLKNEVQELWNRLSVAYNLYGLGWLQINPQQLRLNNFFARNDSLNIFLGLTARPVIRFEKPATNFLLIPSLSHQSSYSGFNIFLDAVMNYDSLSTILNAGLKDKRFDLDAKAGKKYVIIRDCRIYGTGNEKLIIKISFSGSKEGIAYFTGKPVFNESDDRVEIRDLDFDLKTKNLLLKTADWLFNRRILQEISQYTRFDLSQYRDSARVLINQQLNREWTKGVKSSGLIDLLKITGIYPLSDHLIIRTNASGNLMIKLDAGEFSL